VKPLFDLRKPGTSTQCQVALSELLICVAWLDGPVADGVVILLPRISGVSVSEKKRNESGILWNFSTGPRVVRFERHIREIQNAMVTRAMHQTRIVDLGSHSQQSIEHLRQLLAGEATVRPDPRRPGFFDVESGSDTYLHSRFAGDRKHPAAGGVEELRDRRCRIP
jgi:hypothetical protein